MTSGSPQHCTQFAPTNHVPPRPVRLWWRSSPPNDFRVGVKVRVKVRVRARVRVSKFVGELLHQCRPVLLITQASVRPDTCVKLASRDADVTSLVELYVVRAGKTTRQFEFYQKTHNNLRCAKRTICTFVGNNSDICRSTSGCCVNCVIP